MTAAPVGSTDRLTAPPAAVLLVSHGDRGGDAPNAALMRLAEAMSRLLPATRIMAGVLKGEPSLEAAMAELTPMQPGRLLVYPLFMADGYFAREVLPARLAAATPDVTATILDPLGIDPELPAILCEDAVAAASAACREPGGLRLLMIGHGSKFGPASAEATRLAAARLAAASPFAAVETAFLEEAPFAADALGTGHDTVVSGFFFGEGMHAGDDVPRLIAAAGGHALYSGAVGGSPRIADLVAERVRRAP